jgi:hypothetical protein
LGLATLDQLFPVDLAISVLVIDAPEYPTAMHVPLGHATAPSAPTMPREFPAGMSIDQTFPDHRSTNGWRFRVRSTEEPTATQWVAFAHATPERVPCCRDGFVLGTIDQAVPFQRTANVLIFESTTDSPTAKHVVLVGPATPASVLLVPPATARRAEIDQLDPFQCSINALTFEPLK